MLYLNRNSVPTFTTRRRGVAKPLTTAQRLDRIIKSARQIMRKDKGLNGDLDRLPMLTWIMFLSSSTTWSGSRRRVPASPAVPGGR